MKRSFFALVVSCFTFPLFASGLNLEHVCLKTCNSSAHFCHNYLNSKRTISDVQDLLLKIYKVFPVFQTMTIGELKDVVMSSLKQMDPSIEDEKLNLLSESYSLFLAHDTALLSELNFINDNEDIPAGLVFGLIEIGCGALLWLTPFKHVGSGLMVDGTRRIFNQLELKDRDNQTVTETSFEAQN